MENYQIYSMNDIIFEGRNKQYGAYELRHLTDRHTTIGLLVTVSMFALMLIIGNLDIFRTVRIEKPPIAEVFNLKEIPIPVNIVKPKTVTHNIALPKVNTINNTELQVVENTVAAAPSTQEDLNKYATSTVTNISEIVTNTVVAPIENTFANAGTGTVIEKAAEVPAPIKNYAEIMPSFPGGKEALMDYLKNKIRPFDSDVQKGLIGKMVIRFYVDVDGTVRNPEVLKDNIGGRCAEAAITAINKMPKWNPGMQGDQRVKVYYLLPLTFDFTRSSF